MFEIKRANISLNINNNLNSNGKNSTALDLNQEPDYNSDADFNSIDEKEKLSLVSLENDTQWHACLETLQGIVASHNQALYLINDEDGFMRSIENHPLDWLTNNSDNNNNLNVHIQIILGAENLQEALDKDIDLYVDNELIRQWGNLLDNALWTMTYDYLKKEHSQYVYAFRDYAPLTPYKVSSLEHHVLGALMAIVSDNHHDIYFKHDGRGNGTMMENRFNPNTISSKEQYLQFGSTDVEKLKTILELYSPKLDLHEKTTHQWMDWCINTLSDDNRLQFYSFVQKKLGMVSTEIIRNLARRSINNPKILGEIITLIPGCITHMAEHEMVRYVNFLQSLRPEQCDNALALAMYSQKDQVNCSETTQKQMFFNILKVHAHDKLSQLDCIHLVKEYNRTGQMDSLFVTGSVDLKEVNLSFNTDDIYYYLGLSDSLMSEVDKWFKNIIHEIFNNESLTQYWGIKEYKIVANKNPENIISHNTNNTLSLKVKSPSRFNEQLIQEGFNQMLKQIRQTNPKTIHEFKYDINDWLNKYWLNASLEQNLPLELVDADNDSHDTISGRMKNKI
jgi:hypothetical protein